MASLDIGIHTLTGAALLGFSSDRVPNEAARALSPKIGWLMLAAAIAICALGIIRREAWRRWWLTAEDPRSLGLYRIIFGFFVMCNINGLWEHFTFLFTDEGIFTADVARQVHASAQFKGFGDGFTPDEPWGFFDFQALLAFAEGPKWSLLYFWDTPGFFWAHLAAFEIAATLFVIGFRTRASGIATFFLMNSLLFRNHLFWEGSDVVYRVFLAYLICAKSGHAYSVDNWLRCRRLRKQGLLSEPSGPGGGAGIPADQQHPRGLEAIYRLIPAWPRRLMMLQLGAVYTATGVLKDGSVWARGDAIYYAWNLDHFYRFYPQKLSALFGTNLLRVMAWVAHWGEALFFLCVVGMVVNWARAQRFPRTTGLALWTGRLCWATLIGISAAIIGLLWPVHVTPPVPMPYFVTGWVTVLLGIWAVWHLLDRHPLKIPQRAAPIIMAGILTAVQLAVVGLLIAARSFSWTRGPETATEQLRWIAVAVACLVGNAVLFGVLGIYNTRAWRWLQSVGTTQIDRAWIGRWILGRRIWITWHLSLMGGIFILMNIGQFQTGMLSQTIVFFSGLECASFLHLIGRWLGRHGGFGVPKDVRGHTTPIPSEEPTLPHLRRDAAQLPAWVLWSTLAIIVSGTIVAALVHPQWKWTRMWYPAAALLALAGLWQWRTKRHSALTPLDPYTQRPRAPWAYGPIGRVFAGALLVWHLAAVTAWLLPDKDSLHAFRGATRQPFAFWLTRTQTDQGWGMFAPNPPRSNVFLKVLVTTADGEVHDMYTDVYHPALKPIPWIFNDRIRKMNRRIIGGESGNTQWYRKWHARYYCRYWALTEGHGEAPTKVELVRMSYSIPTPEEVARKGPYVPEERMKKHSSQKIEYTEHCRNAVMGQLPNWIRARHGLPELPEGETYRPWIKHKKSAWERAHHARDTGPKPSDEGGED